MVEEASINIHSYWRVINGLNDFDNDHNILMSIWYPTNVQIIGV